MHSLVSKLRGSQLPRFVHLRNQHVHAPSAMNWIKRALGVTPAPATEKPQGADDSKAEETSGPPACFPDDVPFDEDACSSCANPCAEHKQVNAGMMCGGVLC